MLFFDSGGSAAGAQTFFEAMQLIDQVVHVRGCGDGGGCLRDHAFSLSSSVLAPGRNWPAEKCQKVMKSDEWDVATGFHRNTRRRAAPSLLLSGSTAKCRKVSNFVESATAPRADNSPS